MAISDSEIMAKGREVRDKAIQKWMETEADLGGAFLNEEMLAAYQGQVREAFDFIETMFESHTQRDPSRLDAMRDDLRRVDTTLRNPVTGGIDTVKGKVEDWRGEAAEHFWGEYLTQLPDILDNQLAYAGMLNAVLDAVQTMLNESRQAVINLGDKTIQALDAVEDDGGGGGFSIGLAIGAAVAGVLSAATAGTAAIAWAVVAGAAGVGSSLTAEEATVGGANVNEVIRSMVEANAQLWETQHTIEQDIANLLNEDLDQVTQNPSFFRPPLPLVAGFNPADGLSPEELAGFEPPAR
jgi:hypothetical protein